MILACVLELSIEGERAVRKRRWAGNLIVKQLSDPGSSLNQQAKARSTAVVLLRLALAKASNLVRCTLGCQEPSLVLSA